MDFVKNYRDGACKCQVYIQYVKMVVSMVREIPGAVNVVKWIEGLNHQKV